ncbi:MAG TPA: hypothetical protein VG603_11175 [Chitinophagales bacterium]|nr:hypothetical protein [Chitinophagales bacterium]
MKLSFPNKVILTVLLITAYASIYAQSNNVEKILCHKWLYDYVEKNGKVVNATEQQKASSLTFYENHKIKTTDNSSFESGEWHYNTAQKTITLTDYSNKNTLVLTVAEINDKVMVLEYKTAEGTAVKFHLKA